MKKHFIAPALALSAVIMGLAACSPSNGPTSSSGSSTEQPSSVPSDSSEPSEDAPIATGVHQFLDSSYEARREILGKLEKYAVDHALTGLPLYEDSSYSLYNPRVVKGVNSYIPGFGFSILRDGKLNGNLAGESLDKYQNYYHNWNSTDPQTLNAWNDNGSVVPDLFSNCSASLFGTKPNAKQDGYEYYGVLAKQDKPYAVTDDGVNKTPNAEELHQTWRIYVRTGEEGGVAYRTLSSKADRAKYDKRYVQLEDYLTAFKMLLNKSNGLYRGAELANKSGQGAIEGAAAYYSATGGGKKGVLTDEEADFSGVGLKVGTDADGDYLQVTYSVPVNRFYAMYYLNDNMYEPLPAEFVNEVGAGAINGFSTDMSYTPVDNTLSVGPYIIETWETGKLITFKRNDDWFERKENSNLYQIGGIHTDILPGYSTDKNIAFRQFINAESLDSVGIPSDYLKDYSTDPRAVSIPGESVWKLNLNTCTQDLWESLFGENGSITHTQKKDYWTVKPWMSNSNFIRGLFYSIDRRSFAQEQGGTPCINYFSDIYLSNPETGEVYNNTPEHAAALEDFWGDTIENSGFSLALSEAAFKKAINELIADGSITTSTESISINIFWMHENQIAEEGNTIGGYIKKAFDAAAEDLGYPVRLNVVQAVGGAEWTDVYYKHLLVGQFDLAFGSISGNSLNPLNFMEVLKSSNSSGFTLNWGADTTKVDSGEDALVYDGKRWSFDGLWGAADGGIILDENGQATDPINIVFSTFKVNGDRVSIAGRLEVLQYDGLVVDVQDIFGTTDAEDYSDYFEVYPDATGGGKVSGIENISWDESGNFSFTLSGDLAANVIKAGGISVFGVDFTQTIQGVFCGTKSVYFPAVIE